MEILRLSKVDFFSEFEGDAVWKWLIKRGNHNAGIFALTSSNFILSIFTVVRSLMLSTGDDLEVRHYDRLTPLTVETSSIQCYSNVQPGSLAKNRIVICFVFLGFFSWRYLFGFCVLEVLSFFYFQSVF